MSYYVGFCMLMCAIFATACASSASLPLESAVRSESASKSCTNVESTLLALRFAIDPRQYATQQGLDLEGTAVHVIIDVYPDQELTTVPGIIERRDGKLIQALVEPHSLCALADQTQVRSIRRAYEAIPLTGGLDQENRP